MIAGYHPLVGYGIIPLKPIVDAPPGKIRVKMRPHCTVKVYIRNETETRCFVPIVESCTWRIDPNFEQGCNIRP